MSQTPDADLTAGLGHMPMQYVMRPEFQHACGQHEQSMAPLSLGLKAEAHHLILNPAVVRLLFWLRTRGPADEGVLDVGGGGGADR